MELKTKRRNKFKGRYGKIITEEQTQITDQELEYATDFSIYAPEVLKIQTMEGTLVPFQLNEVQDVLQDIIADIETKGHLIRLLILKARREGVSTWTTGRFYWKTSTDFNRYGMIITHEPEATEFLFNMTKRYHLHNPWKPQDKYNNKRILEFNNEEGTGLDSAIRVGTAGKEDFGSGQLIHFCHFSELAKYPTHSINALMTSVLQCIPDDFGTEIIMESTAKGIGGEFYERFWGARYRYHIYLKDGVPAFRVEINEQADPYNIYCAIFIPWFVFKKYEMDIPEGFKRTTEEEEMVKLYGLTDRKLQWRRWAIQNKCNGNVETFKQEYPSNPEEAFLSSGTPVFDVKKLLLLKKYAEAPKKRYECQISSGQWLSTEGGRLKVWAEPIQGKSYIIGADVAEGLEKGDFSCADVIDHLTGEQVAQWHGKIDPDQFGQLLIWLGVRYNYAWIVPERNNHGLAVVTRIIEKKYRRTWSEKIIEPPNRPRTRYGWVTSKKSKPVIVDNLNAELRDDMHGLKCQETFDEMMTFKQAENGKLEAEEGRFDDRVLSIAIAKYARTKLKLPSMELHYRLPSTAKNISPEAWT